VGEASATIGRVRTEEYRKNFIRFGKCAHQSATLLKRAPHHPEASGKMNLVVFSSSRLSLPLMGQAGDGYDKPRTREEDQGTAEYGE
jgi:hypothetical protein